MSELDPPRPRAPVTPWKLALLVVSCVAVLAALVVAQLTFVDRHRLEPRPDGVVLIVEVPESRPLSAYHVAPAPSGTSFVATLPSNDLTRANEVFTIDYPSGNVRRGSAPGGSAPPRDANRPLDLDGDGVADVILAGASSGLEYGLVRVISGADGSVLFEDRDLLEYERDDRAFSLGDLDGDGFGELALVYPRLARVYDAEHVLDALFETHGWIAVVSGSRLFGNAGGPNR
ncbi:FG-GAP repeat protein [Planctomycetes bacterium Pla163]|uniref:FG-GAP repeat protein n=1 Tax=Rohdeia mirabilis TaxID=2528008 RepID=A0A518CVA8_9BACT|nr:FG-GAP repeat protein [Planctomycetes bacterium Pla163]